MAHTKAGGVTKGNRNSQPKRLGVKKYGGEKVQIGNIIVRQRGTHMHAGTGVKLGRDHTLYAVAGGTVQFKEKSNRLIVEVTK